jgi:hypothetical protein
VNPDLRVTGHGVDALLPDHPGSVMAPPGPSRESAPGGGHGGRPGWTMGPAAWPSADEEVNVSTQAKSFVPLGHVVIRFAGDSGGGDLSALVRGKGTWTVS